MEVGYPFERSTITEYELPEGAQLFLYNPTQTEIKGTFTHQNNSAKDILPITPIQGDELIIEYREFYHISYNFHLQ